MHRPMSPIMPCIFHNKKHADLENHGLPAWEWNTVLHSEIFCHRVEEVNLWEFDCEMTEEDQLCASPLLLGCRDLVGLDLVFVEVGHSADYEPGDTASEVHSFMHDETQDSGREDIVLHVGVPTLEEMLVQCVSGGGGLVSSGTYSPKSLKKIQMNVILGQLIVDAHISICLSRKGRIRQEIHGGRDTQEKLRL